MSEQTIDTVYKYVREYLKKYRWSPTFKEIADDCKFSLHTVKSAVEILRARGKLEWTPGVQRSIMLVKRKS